MARKDFELYYANIKSQYFELLSLMKQAGEESAKNLVDPQVIENLKAVVQPVKNSYMALAYVEYLLNLPKDKKVKTRNDRQFQAQLEKILKEKQGKNVLENNNKVIDEVKTIIEEDMK